MSTTNTQHPHIHHDPEAPTYTCFTAREAASEAISALNVCHLTREEYEDCVETLARIASRPMQV